ncbi:MAG: carboxypeptidase-like regulatory domain-containing protein [Terracidiphilus sp.]
MKQKTVVVWAIVAAAVAVTIAVVVVRVRHLRTRSEVIQGAVIRSDTDTRKELPISGVLVTASNGTSSVSTHTDASGYFLLSYAPIVWPGRIVDLSFSRSGYEPLVMHLRSGIHLTTRELYVASLTLIPEPAPASVPAGKESVVSDIKVRYTVNSENVVNIGSAVKTFVIENKGNVPCNHQAPCSPNGIWKAARGSVTLDAGQGNEFREVRASCIAGPCPFTRIDSSGYIGGGRSITASAIDWSDTATFLVEAEVFRDGINSNVRELYPVTFGQTLHFTLPPTQEGVSIEANVNGTPMVFPLGPDLYLSWATCTVRTSSDQDKTTVYRCELKPGYRF